MFENNKRNTASLMLIITMILIAWDILVFFTGPNDDTESHIILEFSTYNFTLPFAMSGLLGHWFWPRENPMFGMTRAQAFFGVVIPVVMTMSILDLFYTTSSWVLPMIAPVGYAFGSFFWPQRAIE